MSNSCPHTAFPKGKRVLVMEQRKNDAPTDGGT